MSLGVVRSIFSIGTKNVYIELSKRKEKRKKRVPSNEQTSCSNMTPFCCCAVTPSLFPARPRANRLTRVARCMCRLGRIISRSFQLFSSALIGRSIRTAANIFRLPFSRSGSSSPVGLDSGGAHAIMKHAHIRPRRWMKRLMMQRSPLKVSIDGRILKPTAPTRPPLHPSTSFQLR